MNGIIFSVADMSWKSAILPHFREWIFWIIKIENRTENSRLVSRDRLLELILMAVSGTNWQIKSW